MAKAHNGRYSKEFRCEAVKMVVEGGISVYEVSRLQKSHFRLLVSTM
jgi:transposase